MENSITVNELVFGPSAETRLQLTYAKLTNIAPPQAVFVRCANCKENVEANKPCEMCDKTNEEN